ncbi:MAG: hypothetical protein MI785_17765 [Kiloniellales bacterium]|nr:hypothetical protein [Kiloniellales bacterium]
MADQKDQGFDFPTWLQPDGVPVSCIEKIKVLNENLEELREMAQDALEDGILMGCDEAQIRNVLHLLVDSLKNPYRENTEGGA